MLVFLRRGVKTAQIPKTGGHIDACKAMNGRGIDGVAIAISTTGLVGVVGVVDTINFL